jgi:hypothetical protein
LPSGEVIVLDEDELSDLEISAGGLGEAFVEGGFPSFTLWSFPHCLDF